MAALSPHSHVLYELQFAIGKSVEVNTLLEHLVHKNVIKKSADLSHYKSRNGMRNLCNYLRGQSYEAFLDFVECVIHSSKDTSAPVITSIIKVLKNYDQQNDSSYAKDVVEIQKKYLGKCTEPEVEAGKCKPEEQAGKFKLAKQVDKSKSDKLEEQASKSEHIEKSKAEEEANKSDSMTVKAAAKEDTPDKESTPVPSPSVESLALPLDLHFVGDPFYRTFTSEGGELSVPEYKFSLSVPSQAVPRDELCRVVIGFCCYGPFSINEHYLLASDFVVIIADREFDLPVTVTMEHSLCLPEYKKCSEVVILKADHHRVTKNKLHVFNVLTHPEISPDGPVLSFQIKNFCILCTALNRDRRASSSFSSMQSLDDPACIDDDNISSGPSSFDDGNSSPGLLRSCSVESNPEQEMMVASTESYSEQEVSLNTSLQKTLLKNSLEESRKPKPMLKKRPRHRCASMEEKRPHLIIEEYTALLFQPSNKKVDPEDHSYQFVIFICLNCTAANKICKQHAQEMLLTKVKTTVINSITFEKALRLEVSSDPGWRVVAEKTPVMSLSEVQLHLMNTEDIYESMELGICPPRILFTAHRTQERSLSFSCSISIKNATTIETKDEVFFSIHVPAPQQVEAKYSPKLSMSLLRLESSESECDSSIRPLLDYRKELSQKERDMEVTQKMILGCSRHIKNWKYTARMSFGLSDATVEQLEQDNLSEKASGCFYKAYRSWEMEFGRTVPTLWELVELLHESEEFEAIAHLIKRIKQRN